MTTWILGSLTFANPPESWSGVSLPKSRVDIETLGGVITQVMGFFPGDREISARWALMPAADFAALLILYQSNEGGDTYTLDPDDGHTYEVEIAGVTGGPPALDSLWRAEVNLQMRVVEVLS